VRGDPGGRWVAGAHGRKQNTRRNGKKKGARNVVARFSAKMHPGWDGCEKGTGGDWEWGCHTAENGRNFTHAVGGQCGEGDGVDPWAATRGSEVGPCPPFPLGILWRKDDLETGFIPRCTHTK